jgi:hypothetical protein
LTAQSSVSQERGRQHDIGLLLLVNGQLGTVAGRSVADQVPIDRNTGARERFQLAGLDVEPVCPGSERSVDDFHSTAGHVVERVQPVVFPLDAQWVSLHVARYGRGEILNSTQPAARESVILSHQAVHQMLSEL